MSDTPWRMRATYRDGFVRAEVEVARLADMADADFVALVDGLRDFCRGLSGQCRSAERDMAGFPAGHMSELPDWLRSMAP